MLYEQDKKEYYEFNDSFFVAGDMFPVCSNTLTHHKNINRKLANVK